MTFIRQGSFHINSSNITGHQHTATISKIHETLFVWSPRPCCVMQIFDRTETIFFVKNFPWGCTEFPRIPRVFHAGTPGFPGLWSPWLSSNYQSSEKYNLHLQKCPNKISFSHTGYKTFTPNYSLSSRQWWLGNVLRKFLKISRNHMIDWVRLNVPPNTGITWVYLEVAVPPFSLVMMWLNRVTMCDFLVSLLRRTLVSTGMFRLSVKHASSGFASWDVFVALWTRSRWRH